MDPCAHLCIEEFLLLSRHFLLARRGHSRTITRVVNFKKAVHSGSSKAHSTTWDVEVHNTAVTRLTYESGRHSVALVLYGVDMCVGNPTTFASLRLKSPRLVLLCDGKEIGLFQVVLY